MYMPKNKKQKEKKRPSPNSLSRNYSGSSAIYTPKPVVRKITEIIDKLLIQKFDIKKGILSQKLTILDPACGRMAFPLGYLKFVKQRIRHKIEEDTRLKKQKAGGKDKSSLQFSHWVHTFFPKKFYMFEIQEEVIGHAKEVLADSNYLSRQDLGEIQLFLGNTLSPNGGVSKKEKKFISHRNQIPHNKDEPLIILGNPPYKISSGRATKNKWIEDLIEDYKKHINTPRRKRIYGLKGIQDEYVKFMRFGQWKLADQGHKGILAFVVNNYFLDGLIFRGMRKSLKEAFDEIYVIDLFGDPKKSPETLAKGEIDENIFDIQTGVCIFIALRLGQTKNINKKNGKNFPQIYYRGIPGTKERKFSNLGESFERDKFQRVPERFDHQFTPASEDYLKRESEFFQYFYLPNIFKENIIGAQSLHDTLVTHPDKERLKEIIRKFYDGTYEKLYFLDDKGQKWLKHKGVSFHDARDWNIDEGLKGSYSKAEKNILKWQRRGFDRWWVAYDEHLMTKGSSSFSLLQFLLPSNNTKIKGKNFAIGASRTSRKVSGENSILITNTIADSHFIEGGSGIGDYVFPLKISRHFFKFSKDMNIKERRNIKNLKGRKTWQNPFPPDCYNFEETFLKRVWDRYKLGDLSFGDEVLKKRNQKLEKLFFYIYGLLWTPAYRQQYQSFLKEDFPRIFLPRRFDELEKIAAVGKELTKYHCLNFNLREIHHKVQVLDKRGEYVDKGEKIGTKEKKERKQREKRKETKMGKKGEEGEKLINSKGELVPKVHSIKIIKEEMGFREKKNTLYLNKNLRITGITRRLWKFELGGVRQIKSWVKYRIFRDPNSQKSHRRYAFTRPINKEELEDLIKIIIACKKTLELQGRLDEIYKVINREK